jgi:hypothetical protein
MSEAEIRAMKPYDEAVETPAFRVQAVWIWYGQRASLLRMQQTV